MRIAQAGLPVDRDVVSLMLLTVGWHLFPSRVQGGVNGRGGVVARAGFVAVFVVVAVTVVAKADGLVAAVAGMDVVYSGH